MAVAETLAAVRSFLIEEAELLDTAQFDEWINLFAEDGIYWVPASIDQPNPVDHVSLFYEDRAMMTARAGRLHHPRAHGYAPPPVRTSRLVTNERIIEDKGLELVIGSRTLVVEYHRERQRLIAGGARIGCGVFRQLCALS